VTIGCGERDQDVVPVRFEPAVSHCRGLYGLI
jgi:hypothetical protein